MSDAAADAVFVERLELGGSGPRVGVKDSIDIAGYATRSGSAAFASAAPAVRHAVVVQALLDSGCRIVGKTTMHELAYGVTGINGWAGTPFNPRYPGRIPGGSSSGSAAAVAGGWVDFAVGTDTGGSIRIPAACCGIYGLKPTYGRISRDGAHPAQSSLDCIGPFAGSLDGIEQAMSLMDPSFKIARPPQRIRLGLIKVTANSDVHAAVRAALGAAQVTTVAVELPSMDEAYQAGLDLIGVENWRAFGHLVRGPLGEDVRARLLASRNIPAQALAEAERCRTQFRATVDSLLERLDALALPTLPSVPPTLAEAADARTALRLTALVRPFNVSGHPALTLPLQTPRGLPAGLQLIGRRGADAELCALAQRLAAPLEPGSRAAG